MPGPPPKPPGQRRRRNPTPGVAALPAGGRTLPVPKPKTSQKLGRIAADYWNTLWSSPMAAVYTDADVFPLTRLALLVNEREAGLGSASGDGEIRQLEDRFGVSPLARRKLSWEIEQASPEEAPVDPRAARVLDDPRRLKLA